MKSAQKSIFIILGPSGSGKEIQSDLLAEEFGLGIVGGGALLRERKKKKDFTGRKIGKIIDRGGLMSTPVFFKLLVDRFEEYKNKKISGFILNGSPRKIFEAYLLDELLEWYEWNKKIKVISIEVSSKEIIQRLSKRRICEKCGKIISSTEKFKKVKKCPVCGGGIIKRVDDTTSSIKKRLAWFKTNVQPVINYYRKTGRLIKVNGEQSIEKVFNDILKAIK